MRHHKAYLLCGGAILGCCLAAAASAQGIGSAFDNPLRYDTVDGLLTSLLSALQATIVVLAMVFIVIGGVMYITSAGNEGRTTMAKGAFTAAAIGLAVAVAAPSFLKEIYKIVGAGPSPSQDVEQAPTIAEIVSNVLQFLLGIAGTIALIAMVIGGIMYLTAGGDENRVDAGKKVFLSAVTGIIIIMASLAIVRTVAGFFA